MTKYLPIFLWLSGLKVKSIAVTFSKLEETLGFELPNSARTHRAWWGNERIPHRHTCCRAWLDAGFETRDVNLGLETLVFHKV
jgi:hypothetical protein